MRAYTRLELELLAEQSGLEVLEFVPSPYLHGNLDPAAWHIAMVARRK